MSSDFAQRIQDIKHAMFSFTSWKNNIREPFYYVIHLHRHPTTYNEIILTVARSTMVAQYLQLCQEEDFDALSRATLFRILEVREASQRKALKGLDNVAADGTVAFETLERVVEELEKAGASREWGDNIKEKLNQAKRYLKTDNKVHCKEESSPCADHCRCLPYAMRTTKRLNRKVSTRTVYSVTCART